MAKYMRDRSGTGDNSIGGATGPIWSPDMDPNGPEPPWIEGLNQDAPGDLYAGLPDIAVPKNRVNGWKS